MGMLAVITDAINRWSVARANIKNRGVVNYYPSQVGGFVESDICTCNVVCSGDACDLQGELIASICIAATNAHVPVIILHQGDSTLTKMLQTTYQNRSDYIEVGPYGKRFDPFFDMRNDEISKAIRDAASKDYPINSEAKTYIDALTGYLSGKGRQISLRSLNKCKHNQVRQLITSAKNKQIIPQDVADDLLIKQGQGQHETENVKAYFEELYKECELLLPFNRADYANCVSISQAVANRAVMNFDIVSDNNNLLLRLIAEQLRMLVNRRIPFFVVLDNIAIREDNAMKKVVSTNSKYSGFAVVADDLYTQCDSEDKVFNTLIGKSGKWFVFHHSSGVTAKKWSDQFSIYQKIDTTYNYGQGNGSGFGFGLPVKGCLFAALNWNSHSSTHQGVTLSNKDEAVIRPDEIKNLSNRAGYVFTASTGEIAYVSSFVSP